MSQGTENSVVGLRDVVLVTLLTALWLVIAVMIIGGITAVNMFAGFVVAPMLALAVCGVIFVLMCAKAPRRGTLLLMSVIIGLYVFLTSGFVVVAVIDVAAGVLMEIIVSGKDGYRNPVRLTIAYAVFGICWNVAPAAQILVAKESMIETFLAQGLTLEYIESTMSYYSVTNLALAVVSIAIGAVIGVAIGRRLLKKHFAPAGVVEGD